MKRLVSSIFLTGCLWGAATLSNYPQPYQVAAQVPQRVNDFTPFAPARGADVIKPSRIFPQPKPVSPEQYLFGRGVVNAEAAIREVKR